MEPQFKSWQVAQHAGVACELPYRRRRRRLRSRQARWRAAADARDYQPGADAGASRRRHASWRAGAALLQVSQARTVIADSVRVTRVSCADDEANSETMSAMQMHVSHTASSERGIHWHANPSIRVECVATGEKGETIPYVQVTDAQGQVREYVAPDTPADVIGGTRQTDGLHGLPQHGGPSDLADTEQAVDRAIAELKVSRDLPFVRREGVRLLKEEYPSQDAAAQAIDQGLRNFYRVAERCQSRKRWRRPWRLFRNSTAATCFRR